jgi:EamA-like transporter family
MERSDWIKGISFSVAASVIGGVSKLAIRKSWLLEEEKEKAAEEEEPVPNNVVVIMGEDEYGPVTVMKEETNGRCLRATAWSLLLRYTGMFGMMVLNPLCGVIAMNYASPSITAPFSGLTLVWIVLWSECSIGEKPSFRQVVAATLIVLGEVIVAIWGDHTNDEGVTLDDVVSCGGCCCCGCGCWLCWVAAVMFWPPVLTSFSSFHRVVKNRKTNKQTNIQKRSYHNPGFVLYCFAFMVWSVFLIRWMRDGSSPTMQRFAWGTSGGSLTGTYLLVLTTAPRCRKKGPIYYLEQHSITHYPKKCCFRLPKLFEGYVDHCQGFE